MNDKILIQDLLVSVKAECGLLLHGTIEASSPDVREVFTNCLNESLRLQNDLYLKMSEKGWYDQEKVSETRLQELEQKYLDNTL
jgi:spore coat protein CotF